jgi:hypothetical protein
MPPKNSHPTSLINGSDYEPTSIRGIISSIDRKLRRHRYGHYIGGDEKHTKFALTKETLKTKMKLYIYLMLTGKNGYGVMSQI